MTRHDSENSSKHSLPFSLPLHTSVSAAFSHVHSSDLATTPLFGKGVVCVTHGMETYNQAIQKVRGTEFPQTEGNAVHLGGACRNGRNTS